MRMRQRLASTFLIFVFLSEASGIVPAVAELKSNSANSAFATAYAPGRAVAFQPPLDIFYSPSAEETRLTREVEHTGGMSVVTVASPRPTSPTVHPMSSRTRQPIAGPRSIRPFNTSSDVGIASIDDPNDGHTVSNPQGYRFQCPFSCNAIIANFSYNTQLITQVRSCALFVDGVNFQLGCSGNGGVAVGNGPLNYSVGKFTLQAEVVDQNFVAHFSAPIGIFEYSSLSDLPQTNPCKQTQTGQSAGQPCDVVTGRLWYRHLDFALSGPAGLRFERWYDNQTTYSGDLGYGWRHSYSAFLDMTNVGNGLIVLHDEHDRLSLFNAVSAGSSDYDNFSGDQLSLNSSGTIYTLVRWHGQQYQFDTSGRLSQILDRAGNPQLISRDGTGRISKITDVLGRTLSFSYDACNRISAVTSSPAGVSLPNISYDSTTCGTANLASVTEPDGETWTYHYTDPNPHNLTLVNDPGGNIEEQNSFNGNKLATQFIGSAGSPINSLTFLYNDTCVDQNGVQTTNCTTITTTTGGNTRMTHFVYDPTDLVVTYVNGPLCRCSNGTNRAFTWDQFLRITSVTDGDGPTHAVTLVYNRDIVNTSPGGTFTVQAFPGPTSVVEPLRTGHTRTIGLTYFPTTDVRRDLINQATFPSVDPSGSLDTLTNTFQTDGTFTKQSMVGLINGVATTFTATATYDSKGRIKTLVGPRTDVVAKYSFIYFPDTSSDLFKRGQLQTITDPLSHVTSIANGPSPFNTYDLFGNAKSMTDQNSVVTEYTYDGNGRPLTNTLLGVPGDPADLTTTFGYDAVGRLNSITRPGGNGVSATYDAAGRLTHVVRFDATLKQNERLTLSYDNVSELTGEDTETCPSPMPSCPSWTITQQDSFSYDSNARLHKVVHPIPVGAQIVYGYDGAGNLTSVTDENHSAANATVGYDLANRPVTLTQKLATASGGAITTSLTYDDLDDVTQVSDPNGNLTQLAVDDFGRVRQQISPVSGTSTYSHDPDGNLLGLNDANSSSTTAIYDALDRLTSMSAVQGTSVENVAFSYDDPTNGHFGIGELATMTDPTGSSTYTYERRGKVVSDAQVINGSSYTTGFAYDSNGNPSGITYPSTRLVTYGYDFADRPTSATSGGTTYVSAATYEPFGPIASLTFGNQTKQTLSYDQRYEPTENKLINTSSGTQTIADYTYGEDPAGNITLITDAMSVVLNRSFGYDDLNRLTSANSAVWGISGNGYTYDNMGNVKSATLGSLYNASFNYVGTTPKISSVMENGTSRPVSYDNAGNEKSAGSVTYNYSPRELLSSSSDGLSYSYNGVGIRSISTDAGVGSRYSFYSPNLNLLSESKAVQSGSPSIDYDYIWFSGRPVAQVNSNVGNSGTYWTFADHLGTPVVQTDVNRAVPWRAEYEPFGEIATLRAGDVHQPLRFPGQVAEQFDNGANGATERSYNLTRFYRPNWGRYTQPDEIGLNGGLNLFRYASDNPIRYADPDGRIVPVLLFLLIPVLSGIGQGFAQAFEAGLVGCNAAQAFGIGFISGLTGGLVGEAVAPFFGPLGPVGGGAVGGVVDEALQDGLTGEQFTFPKLLASGAGGLAGGYLGSKLFPEVGRHPDLFELRDLSDLGPNSLREVNAAGVGGFSGTGMEDIFLQRANEGGGGCGCL